jgi:hypothetical protein
MVPEVLGCTPKGQDFISVLNKVNMQAFKIDFEVLKFLKYLRNIKYSKYYVGETDIDMYTLDCLVRQSEYYSDTVFFLEHKFERRGRFTCMTRPINPQHIKHSRYLLKDAVPSSLAEVLDFVDKNGLWEYIDVRDKLPDGLDKYFNENVADK